MESEVNKALVPGLLESATFDFSVNDVISSTFTQVLSSKVETKIINLDFDGGTRSKDTPQDLGVLTFHTSSQQNSGKKQSKHFICRKTPGDKLLIIPKFLYHVGFRKKSWDALAAGFLNRAAHLSVSDSHPRPGLFSGFYQGFLRSFGGIQLFFFRGAQLRNSQCL